MPSLLRKQLSDPKQRTLRFAHQRVIQLSEGETVLRGVELAKLGTYQHPNYGSFAITRELVEQMQKNFRSNAYGQKIFVDVAHEPDDGAAAEITNLYLDGEWLKGDLELTEFGRDAITKRKFIYLSIDYADAWANPATGENVGAVLFGAGLTIRPFIKGQAGIELAEPSEIKELKNMNKFLDLLRKYLSEKKASTRLSEAVVAHFEVEAKKLGDSPSDDALSKLLDGVKAVAEAAIDTARKTLSEAQTDQPIQLAVTAGVTHADVERILSERETQRQNAQVASSKKLGDNQKTFTDAIDAAQGLTESTVKVLKEALSLVTAEMTDAQVKALAEQQIKIGHQLEVSRQLSGMGYQVQGNPSISIDQVSNVRTLQERVDQALRGSNAHVNDQLRLSESQSPRVKAFVNKVLAEFDRRNAVQLAQEHRVLADNASTQTNNFWLPASFQRTLIREALSDLRLLELVQTIVDPSATETTLIPFEVRFDGAVANDGIVFEGQGIPFAGVSNDHESAYISPMKLALKVSNEAMYFSNSSLINWNAWGENIASNARLIRELIHMRVANEMQRAADSYLAQVVVDEDVTASAAGVIKTAQFPVVRPFQARNLRGDAMGNPENPLKIMDGTTEVKYWTGVEDLAAGLYWRFANVNLGYIQLVNEKGITAGAGKAVKISYSYATNLIKFDLKHANTVAYEKHLNGLLNGIGDQAATLSSQRYMKPDYAAMSDMLNNEVSKAEQFIVSLKRNGTDTNAAGDLQSVKALPTFNTNAPNVDLGDQRVLIGKRGLTAYSIAKPYSVGQPFEAVNAKGQPIGMKMAYGEEYNAIYTPTPVRKYYSSVLVFDSSTR